MKKALSLLILIFITSCLLVSCDDGKSQTYTPKETEWIDTSGMDLAFTERDISGDYNDKITNITLSGDTAEGYAVANGALTINEEGTYIISGSGDGIMLVVDAEGKKVQLVLNNLSLNNDSGPAIYVKDASKVFITAPAGTKSTVTDGEDYSFLDGDTAVDAAIFSKADLTVNGTGVLSIEGNCKHGIVSKDDMVIVDTSLSVLSTSCGIEGKDCVKIKDASLIICSGSDGIRADNTEDAKRGYVYIESGDFSISSINDGIQAQSLLKICDGSFIILSGTDSQESGKGLKSYSDLIILGGVFEIFSHDDAIHSDKSILLRDAQLTLKSDDDGIHADKDINIEGSNINITQSYEGLEGERIHILSGSIDITASDDGLNASGGNDGSGMKGPFGRDDMFGSSDAEIIISGGYVSVDAGGDGIDSNGSITVTGGITLVSGPVNNGNGALDYSSSATVYGGVFIATGTVGMAQSFSDSYNQGSMLVNTGTQRAYTSVAICDRDGRVLASFTPNKAYQCAVISTPDIKKNEEYVIVCGGTVTNADAKGYGTDTSIDGGTVVLSVEMESLLYGSTDGMGGGMMGGGMGGRPPRPR